MGQLYSIGTEELWASGRNPNARGTGKRQSSHTLKNAQERAIAGLAKAWKGQAVSEGLRLTIELVPRTSWCDNLRTAVTHQTWDQIRRAAYREYDYRCGICGARGRMTCHERWAYDDDTATQTLLGFMALCELCHHVKHIGLAGILARKGQLDYDEVVRHFIAVNDCDESTFEEHRAQAYDMWRQRSTHPWTVDLGPYAAMVSEKEKGVPL